MPTHIFVNRESGNDTISIFYDEPSFIVVANKEDLPFIQQIDEANRPGIYILLGENKRYIGQASGSILSRIQQHYQNKSWWNKLIFFGREDGHLTKAQLDLLERILIKRMQDSKLKLDNGTQGNHSYIDKLSKSSATSLLSKVEKVLLDIANIDLFDLEENELESSLDENTDSVSIFLGSIRYTGKSYREVFINALSDLLTSTFIKDLSPIICNNEPNTINIVGTMPKISPKGAKLTRKIDSTNYHIYINFSKNVLQAQLKKIAKLTNQKLIFEKW